MLAWVGRLDPQHFLHVTAGCPSCHQPNPPNDSSSDGTTSVCRVTPSQPHQLTAAVAGLQGEFNVRSQDMGFDFKLIRLLFSEKIPAGLFLGI